MSSNPNWLEDRQLKERCLEGEGAAWTLLYEGNLRDLVCYSRSLLVLGPIPGLTADDVAANVFGSLWENDCHLIRYYEPERAPWQTFLRLLARRQIITGHRREHECALTDGDLVDRGADGGLVQAEFHEFADALTAHLRQWFAEEVLGVTDPAAPPTSPAARRKSAGSASSAGPPSISDEVRPPGDRGDSAACGINFFFGCHKRPAPRVN